MCCHAFTGTLPSHPTVLAICTGCREDGGKHMSTGKPIDTDRWFVVAPNVLWHLCRHDWARPVPHPTSGFTIPDLLRITIRDQVSVEALLTNHLNIERYALCCGRVNGRDAGFGMVFDVSRQGCRRMGWSVGGVHDSGTDRASTLQIQAIMNDPNWCGGLCRQRECSRGTGLPALLLCCHTDRGRVRFTFRPVM